MRHVSGRLRRVLLGAVALSFVAGTAHARSLTFSSGSLIIPMDTTYQPLGVFKAFGLVHKLLLANVPVHWAIKPGKQVGDPGEADFVASAVDVQSKAAISNYGYRGGPFIVDVADATMANLVISTWQAANVTVVHRASAAFDAPIARTLTAAPTIGVFADGNEQIAFSYLNAAGILDRNGKTWPTGKLNDYSAYPDVLTSEDIAGASYTNPRDGKLFDAKGLPVFCQIMTMHWKCMTGCGEPNALQDAVVAELAEFLHYPTHVFAECQAVTAIERNPNGRFVAPQGVWMDAQPQDPFTFRQGDLPFAQMDGPYQNPGGSEPSYSVCDPAKKDGDAYPNCVKNGYYDNGIVMITQPTTPLIGVRDVWMTGYARGSCTISENDSCASGGGKVSYLGGHAYSTTLPLKRNPKSQGTRLFLNSLFEASCTVSEGQPMVTVEVIGPQFTSDATVTYSLRYGNDGPGMALGAVLDYPLPSNATFVSATGGGSASGTHVTWSLGNLGAAFSSTVQVTVKFPSYASYTNAATLNYRVGLNDRRATSENLVTVYATSCTPVCAGSICGSSDGCGGYCSLDAGCCTPSCAGMACGGSDGCGGLCTVGSGCICDPSCATVVCGAPDGCGSACLPGSGCTCVPSCSGITCGSDDGCGGVCTPGSGCDAGDGGRNQDGGVADADPPDAPAPVVDGAPRDTRTDVAIADSKPNSDGNSPADALVQADTGKGDSLAPADALRADAASDALTSPDLQPNGPDIAKTDAAGPVLAGRGCNCSVGNGRDSGGLPGWLIAAALILVSRRRRGGRQGRRGEAGKE